MHWRMTGHITADHCGPRISHGVLCTTSSPALLWLRRPCAAVAAAAKAKAAAAARVFGLGCALSFGIVCGCGGRGAARQIWLWSRRLRAAAMITAGMRACACRRMMVYVGAGASVFRAPLHPPRTRFMICGRPLIRASSSTPASTSLLASCTNFLHWIDCCLRSDDE